MGVGHNGGFRPQEMNRRRFQEAAAITIDNQAKAIQQTRELCADLSVRIDRNVANLGTAFDNIGDVRNDFDAFRRRWFWARLRWLFLGR